MAPQGPGVSLPNEIADDVRGMYYAWRATHPVTADDDQYEADPDRARLAAFAAGVKAGRRAMFRSSSAWINLEPMLEDLLNELVELRLEREMERLPWTR
ncbi:MAG TPA: hypothetical protein VKD28_02010 [Gemmatimonadales bacterium]|nr:hypothetical protein [Gemmatimonadales bacterium]